MTGTTTNSKSYNSADGFGSFSLEQSRHPEVQYGRVEENTHIDHLHARNPEFEDARERDFVQVITTFSQNITGNEDLTLRTYAAAHPETLAQMNQDIDQQELGRAA